MKKVCSFTTVFLSIVLMAGCGTSSNTDLERHQNTLNRLDTYTIEVFGIKNDARSIETTTNYVFVDNINKSFLLSSDKEDVNQIKYEDIVFEYDENKMFGYLFDDAWYKYEIDDEYLSIKNFEEEIFNLFKTQPSIADNGEKIYEAYASMSELKGKLFNISGFTLSKEYYAEDILISANYSSELMRFTSFTFDLSNILTKMNEDDGLDAPTEVSWIVNYSFEDFNEEFSITLDDYTVDDYIDCIECSGYANLFKLNELLSYEMIKGCVDYVTDKDIVKVEFERTGLYRLLLSRITDFGEIHVTILDENFEVFREEVLDSAHNLTKYFTYQSGTYYLVITANDSEFFTTAYHFIFIND